MSGQRDTHGVNIPINMVERKGLFSVAIEKLVANVLSPFVS